MAVIIDQYIVEYFGFKDCVQHLVEDEQGID